MSPDLFAEKIMRIVKDFDGIKVRGININNIRYADDTTIVADSQAKLQNLHNMAVVESEPNGLSVNQKKSTCMVISKLSDTPSCSNLMVNGEKIEQVDKFVYRGSALTQDGECDSEISVV